MTCAEWYRWFGEKDAVGRSPTYARLAVAVADDVELCHRIDQLPGEHRQPNLLFAAVRSLGGPVAEWPVFRSFVFDRWDEVSHLMATRFTQTNEAARCGVLVPALAAIEGPLALIELGTSAGLCLYPDRYAYRYGTEALGRSSLTIDIECSGGVPVPDALPDVVWRVGIDRAPRDVTNADDRAWLEACIWPEQTERRRRFDAAAAIVAADPPTLVHGDAVEELPSLLAQVPAGATPVVFHSVALFYFDPEQRRALAELLADQAHVDWLSLEPPDLTPAIHTDARPPEGRSSESYMVLGRRAVGALALSCPHGSWLHWL